MGIDNNAGAGQEWEEGVSEGKRKYICNKNKLIKWLKNLKKKIHEAKVLLQPIQSHL